MGSLGSLLGAARRCTGSSDHGSNGSTLDLKVAPCCSRSQKSWNMTVLQVHTKTKEGNSTNNPTSMLQLLGSTVQLEVLCFTLGKAACTRQPQPMLPSRIGGEELTWPFICMCRLCTYTCIHIYMYIHGYI